MVRTFTPAFLKRSRFWLAGPIAFLVAVIVMLGMAIWFPPGVGMVDNIVMPLVLFPLLWAVCFFYAYMSANLKHVLIAFLVILIAHSALFAAHYLTGASA